MTDARNYTSGTFPMATLAIASVALVIMAALWQFFFSTDASYAAGRTASSTSATSSSEAALLSTTASSSEGIMLTPVGVDVVSKLSDAYSDLASRNAYTPAAGAVAAKTIAASLRPDVTSHTYTSEELSISQDTSKTRLLAYRTDLQTALKPLLNNKQYELQIYADYIATQNPADLVALQQSALNYHTAASNAAHITVPMSAVSIHLNVVNALERFGSTLAAQTASTADPYGSAALLSSYNTAESDVFLSFQKLAEFFRDTIPS